MNTPTAPPRMAPANLALRFGLELAALAAWGWTGWAFGETWGALRWLAALGLPAVAIGLWGTFNVPGDPSRSGRAPVPVSGAQRLCIEVLIFFGGWTGLAVSQRTSWALGLALATVAHYAASARRLAWMLRR